MPVRRSKDSKGPFYQWGEHGKRYYYTPGDAPARTIAMNKAATQGRAIKASQSRRPYPWHG